MDGRLYGYRLLPSVTGEDRPCQASLPLANTPYFAVERPLAQTWPECFMDPGVVANLNRGRVPGRR